MGIEEAKYRTLEWLCRYLRVQVEGLERVPRSGPGVIIANHSGYTALDALVLAHVIEAGTGRKPRVMAHRAYFDSLQGLRTLAYELGLRNPDIPTGLRTLRHGHLLIVFPEGEAGNFKPSWRRYRLEPFHPGFLRLAARAGAPIIPALIVGAEETHLNAGNINLSHWVKGLRIPLPLNLLPLPAKWRIRFLETRQLPAASPRRARASAGGHGSHPARASRIEGDRVRKRLQSALTREVRRRKAVF